MESFGRTKTEQRSVWFILLLLFLSLFLYGYLHDHEEVEGVFLFGTLESKGSERNNSKEQEGQVKSDLDKKRFSWRGSKKRGFSRLQIERSFNPCRLKKNDWEVFGFSKKKAEVLESFFFKKLFYSKSQFDSIVCLDSAEKLLLFQFAKPNKYCLNEATKAELMAVKGVGEVLADRILKYRKGLGGFASVEQLDMVYGLKEATADRLKKTFVILEPVKKISINSASLDDLKAHLLIKPKESWKIIELRGYQKIASYNDLFSVISDSSRVKLLHQYVSCE